MDIKYRSKDTLRQDPEGTSDDLTRKADLLCERLAQLNSNLGKVIFGQEDVIEQVLITLLAGGHALLVGAPGLAKTRLVENLGIVFAMDEKRIQCTPDLMPSDIIGAEVLEENETGRRSFRFIPGPVFSQLLMADEINRASPRTQSALLQAMQEHTVTVAGISHKLPAPFHVLATQNPLEQEGTYPLPEAQLDRFLLEIYVGYPDKEAERQMLLATTGTSEPTAETVLTARELLEAQKLVREIPVGEDVLEGILALVRNGRPEDTTDELVRQFVAWGPGPRASQALLMASKARCLLQGRLSPSLEDVVALAMPVLRHRIHLDFTARAEGITLTDIINRLITPLT
ncbi:MoxR family ATPase [Kiloniella laminariae]|uniref:MoxR family ATPase n=1 Tax=Kiloniella laminariae TaxID=454162 RepID=A0ABT4LL51_9PROT|nr:MoxR family ATPase [Kiloniella laminariae]MCZ4281843.1 MoxR family ATPase [Kiloniella laminariae]